MSIFVRIRLRLEAWLEALIERVLRRVLTEVPQMAVRLPVNETHPQRREARQFTLQHRQ